MDKPVGPTSHDAVAAVRRLLGERRVGHAGTLDPAASGLLVVLVGRATRLARFVGPLPKSYRGTVRFGSETDSDDADGAATATDESWRSLDARAVEAGLAEVASRGEQVPPAVSAKKVGGERAYRLARRGSPADLEPVRVAIHRLAATRLALPDLDVEVECSSGTYVRAIARDLGRALGTRAHLAALRRTRIGPWDVAQAVPLDGASTESLGAALRPPAEAVAHLPALEVGPEVAERARHGAKLDAGVAPGGPAAGACDGPVAFTREGTLLAVMERRGSEYAPLVVLAP